MNSPVENQKNLALKENVCFLRGDTARCPGNE
jgi:hypothetical protein